MKYFIRTDIKKVSFANNKGEKKTYSSTPYKRDKKDLASQGGFMTFSDLLKWYKEELNGSIDNPSLEELEAAWLEGGDNTIAYTTQKISEGRFNELRAKFGDITHVVEFNNSKDAYVANGDLLFLDHLERNNIKYELT